SGIPGCTGTPNQDVWYSFVATETEHLVIVDGNTLFDAVIEGFSGACGTLTSIGCADATLNNGVESLILSGLTIGETYHVRVYDWYNDFDNDGLFTICITPVPPPPANDDCDNATPVAVNAGLNCTTVASGTLAFA